MHLCEIALRRLQRWRNLDVVHIPRLYFCLHQKIENAINLFCQNAENTHLGLIDDRLLPYIHLAIVGIYMDALY